jgi:hypothetical protein
MQGLKSLFVCVLVIVLGNTLLRADAKDPEAPAKSEQKAKADAAGVGFCQCVGRDESSAAKRIEDALDSPLHQTGLDYSDQPLQDVVTQLSDEYGIPIQLDRQALEEAGIGTDAPVNVNLHNITLRSALKLALRHTNLTWVIGDEVLMITTQAEAEKHLDTCVYNIQGLIDDSDPKAVKALIDVICSCVASDSWAVNGGGQAEIRPLPSGLLVVSHTPAVQEQVSALLSKIRKMREQAPLAKSGAQHHERPAAQSTTDNTSAARSRETDASPFK